MLSLSANTCNIDNRTKEIMVTATPSGNYTNGTGDTVNLTNVANPNQIPGANFGFPGNIMEYEVVQSPLGYIGTLVKGATLATWALKVEQTGAALSGPLAELASAAYPAGVLAGTFTLRFRGPKLQF